MLNPSCGDDDDDDGWNVDGRDDDGCVKFRSLFSISAGALARRNCGKSGYTHDKSLIVSHDTVHTGTLVKNTQAGQTVREVHLDMLQSSVPPLQERRRDAWRGGVRGEREEVRLARAKGGVASRP